MDAVELEFRRLWGVLWGHIGVAAPDVEPLIGRYAEAHRHYHNTAHILDCLGQYATFREATGHADAPALTVALFYHDVIYDPRGVDNEQKSAALAQEDLEAVLPQAKVADVKRLIVITDHRQPPARDDERLMVDIDLSILGRSREVFERYDAAIRSEYAHVPEEAYRAGRAKILRSFLERPRLYHTAWFFEQYEAMARVNLMRTIVRLEGGTSAERV
jgi:predicted metal-dependent HD superfamily phosphohydrolase